MPALSDYRLQIHPSVYSLSLPTRPGSVRDWMWRAEKLAIELTERGEVRAGTQVLVVGAGPTGLVLSERLLEHGAAVIVATLSAESQCLDDEGPDQRPSFAGPWTCRTRMLCPTTNDFPADHWNEGVFPRAGDDFDAPFFWSRDLAHKVYARLAEDFRRRALGFSQRLEVYQNSTIDSLSVGADQRLSVTIRHNGRELPPAGVDVVILCTGSRDRTALRGSAFAGFSFWSDEDPLIVRPETGGSQRVLVVGGGDGGLGEFIRLLSVEPELARCLEFLELPEDFLEELKSTSQEFWRSFSSEEPIRDDHAQLVLLQGQLIQQIDAAWENSEQLRARVRSLLRRPGDRPFVQLASSCYHFGVSYVANRVVAQLLARALAESGTNGGLAPFHASVRCAVAGSGVHTCEHDPQTCRNAPHEVAFTERTCRDGVSMPGYFQPCLVDVAREQWKATVSDAIAEEPFDRIIVRVGADPATDLLPGDLRMAIARAAQTADIRDVPPFYSDLP